MPEHTPRPLGVDVETLNRWKSRGLLRARKLRSDQVRPGWEDAPLVAGIGAAPILVVGSDDLVAIKACPVD
jgi:predicted site-specific integrase-resolvase